MHELLRRKDVLKLTKLSSSTIWRLEKQGLFPKHMRISKRAIAWKSYDVQSWLEGKFQSLNEEKQSCHQ